MARRRTPAQVRADIRRAQAKLREASRKQRQAVNKFKQEVRKLDRNLQHAVDNHNRKARQHNARVRANRQRIKRELSQVRYGSGSGGRLSVSSRRLHRVYARAETRLRTEPATVQTESFRVLSAQEVANSLSALNMLEGRPTDEDPSGVAGRLGDTTLTTELTEISVDLQKRWHGALFSLSPDNPDAARHFCISAREVFVGYLELSAPDEDVMRELPDCDLYNGRPTRRSRIRLLLKRKALTAPEVEEFVDQDIDDILDLFDFFNSGAHGSAGKFGLRELRIVKRRVEDGIRFLASLRN